MAGDAGEPFASLGPTPIFGRDRTFIYSGLSGQRYPSSSSRGLDHLLPPGLGVEAHMAQSAMLPSPFKAKPWPEADVCFMVEAVTRWQVYLIPRAAEQRRILRSVAQALVPLRGLVGDYALPPVLLWWLRPSDQLFCATLAILLRWPDLSLGSSLVEGFHCRCLGE